MLIVALTISATVVLNMKSFGKLPRGNRLERIEQSPNYHDGRFWNLEETPHLTSDRSIFTRFWEFATHKVKDRVPSKPLPVEVSNLKGMQNNSVVWLGHSTYLLKMNDKFILVDPVFHSASPFSSIASPFAMEYSYSVSDLPPIDFVVITHDHWDHLDYLFYREYKAQVKYFIAPLGVGEHLEYWGCSPDRIIELDWQDKITIDGVCITCLPARHFSGRGLSSYKTLWASYMIQSNNLTLYFQGDSGYGKHIPIIAEQFPSIDFAFMENGQYNEEWRYVHQMPVDLEKSINTLGAKHYITGHNSKFSLARHAWYEPLENLVLMANGNNHCDILTPRIGQVVTLDTINDNNFTYWWRSVML